MKKTLLILGMFMLSLSFAHAGGPGYWYYNSTGTFAPFNWAASGILPAPTTILAAPANEQLSSSQPIPFSWSFYGQSVTSYKASDNGYITFDPTATKSVANSKSLPDTAKATPKNAIFALWTDLEVKTNPSYNLTPSIRTFNYGSAPNRVHVIEWYYVSKAGSPFMPTSSGNFLIFSIRLYEAGGFDIVHTTDISNISNNALIGTQNSDGTLGTMVEGSPTLGPPNPKGTGANAKDLVYNFRYGVQPVNDGGITAAVGSDNAFRRTLPTFIINEQAVVSGTIVNNGSAPITSINVNYAADNGAPQVYNLTGITIAHNGGSYIFSHSNPYSASGAGKFHLIKIWLSNINGTTDDNKSNDTTNQKIFVINGINNAVKKPLIEEINTAWCGWDPDAHNVIKTMKSKYPGMIVVTHHTTDSMTTPESADFANFFGYGQFYSPFATIDRHLFTEDPTILADQQAYYKQSPAFTRTYWDQGYGEQSQTTSVPVKLDILTKSYDPSTRQISFTVTGNFTDYAGGDIRINTYICENNVRGSNSEPYMSPLGWNQHNFISKLWSPVVSNDPANPFYNEPASIIGYLHEYVVRKAITGSFGASITGDQSGNEIISPSTSFTKTYTYTLPAETKVKYSGTPVSDAWYSTASGRGANKPEDIYLVAFVANYSPEPTYNEVLNATQVPLLGWSTGIQTAENSPVHNINLYPNPTFGQTVISYNLFNAAPVNIDIYNTLGQKVKIVQSCIQTEGSHSVSFDMSQFNNGLYFISINSNNTIAVKEFMVQK